MSQPIFVAAYHQSAFGRLLEMTVPDIIRNAVFGTCGEIGIDPSVIDVGSISATCNLSLNEQGLLAGLVACVPGMEGKPIETVENACASGGQAILSVIYKLLLGLGDIGIAVGYEKMRNAQGKMDGKQVGKALGHFSHPDERPGKVYVFPHLFAEIMDVYMKEHHVAESDLAQIAVAEYANAQHNPHAQMRGVKLTVDQALRIEGINRYIVDGLPLKTFDCSQISDGYAALILATERGLGKIGVSKQDCVEVAGYAQATDPLLKKGRDVLRPPGAFTAMRRAYEMARVSPADINVAEIHDCFTVMGAIGTEVIGKATYGKGTHYWTEGKADPCGECGINTSGGLIAKGHPIGATGVAMVGWCFWQLLGRVPAKLQVPNPRIAATFNIGGPICASVCTVLRCPS